MKRMARNYTATNRSDSLTWCENMDHYIILSFILSFTFRMTNMLSCRKMCLYSVLSDQLFLHNGSISQQRIGVCTSNRYISSHAICILKFAYFFNISNWFLFCVCVCSYWAISILKTFIWVRFILASMWPRENISSCEYCQYLFCDKLQKIFRDHARKSR